MRRHRKIEVAHQTYEFRAITLLQARILRDLLRQRGVAAVLVLVCWIDFQRGIQSEHLIEEAVVQCLGVARGQIRPSRGPDEQRVSCEQAVLDEQTHRVSRMSRSVHDVDSQLPEHDGFPIADTHIHEGRRARLMHGDGYVEAPRQLPGGGEVVRVSVRVDDMTNAQPVMRGQRNVAIDLAQLRIDQGRRASVWTADQIGSAAPRRNRLEQHR